MTMEEITLAHIATVAYALINRSDWGSAACFMVNAICCVAIFGIAYWNDGAALSGCATRIGLPLCDGLRRASRAGRCLLLAPLTMHNTEEFPT